MRYHSDKSTNTHLFKVIDQLYDLIGWAEDDAEHAAANDAAGTEQDDQRRGQVLSVAVKLVTSCLRS